ncbi:putative inorganic phosphate cotransporter [Zerene cesonia]|uniref:putative inorganic phosphate cotransporter n=1 Tax=Zerene cesonia TaxID=33412 RepID=UPI0018E55BB5|nr:putative inorganic phosphate cotransporter [Zerene cesonia]
MDTDFLRYKFEDSHDGVITKTKFKLGIRHLQIAYMFAASVAMGMMRGSTGVGILAISETNENSYVQAHHWNRRIQGTILTWYFFGYALTIIPAEKYLTQVGEKFVLTSVLLINGALSAAMPTIVNKGGWVATCNAQFLLGMTQACVTPINQKLIANWLPPYERRIFNQLIQGGLLLGIIIALPLSGVLSESTLSWELIFYSQAMMTFSMAAVWGLLTASSPEKHKAIGDSESEFIREAIRCYREKKTKKPWRLVIRTHEFWSIAVVHASTNAIFTFFLADMPAYLKTFKLSLPDESIRDVTQNFGGTLLAMTSVVASLVGSLVPLVTGVIVGDDPTDQSRWKLIFFILTGLSVFCNVFYTVFGSSDRQIWDDVASTKFGYTNDASNLELEELGTVRQKHTKNELESVM